LIIKLVERIDISAGQDARRYSRRDARCYKWSTNRERVASKGIFMLGGERKFMKTSVKEDRPPHEFLANGLHLRRFFYFLNDYH
jgi:hypothetical protein